MRTGTSFQNGKALGQSGHDSISTSGVGVAVFTNKFRTLLRWFPVAIKTQRICINCAPINLFHDEVYKSEISRSLPSVSFSIICFHCRLGATSEYPATHLHVIDARRIEARDNKFENRLFTSTMIIIYASIASGQFAYSVAVFLRKEIFI